MIEQWCHGIAECLGCGWSWCAVWELGAAALECKSCGSMDTIRSLDGGKQT